MKPPTPFSILPLPSHPYCYPPGRSPVNGSCQYPSDFTRAKIAPINLRTRSLPHAQQPAWLPLTCCRREYDQGFSLGNKWNSIRPPMKRLSKWFSPFLFKHVLPRILGDKTCSMCSLENRWRFVGELVRRLLILLLFEWKAGKAIKRRMDLGVSILGSLQRTADLRATEWPWVSMPEKLIATTVFIFSCSIFLSA